MLSVFVCPWHRKSTNKNCQLGISSAIRLAKDNRLRLDPRIHAKKRRLADAVLFGFRSSISRALLSLIRTTEVGFSFRRTRAVDPLTSLSSSSSQKKKKKKRLISSRWSFSPARGRQKKISSPRRRRRRRRRQKTTRQRRRRGGPRPRRCRRWSRRARHRRCHHRARAWSFCRVKEQSEEGKRF